MFTHSSQLRLIIKYINNRVVGEMNERCKNTYC